MSTASREATRNVVHFSGLTDEEWLKLSLHAQKLIRQGWATDMGEAGNGTQICIYDRFGASYTVGREGGMLHLRDPEGGSITTGKTLPMITRALDAKLHSHK